MQWRRRKRRTSSDPSANGEKSISRPRRTQVPPVPERQSASEALKMSPWPDTGEKAVRVQAELHSRPLSPTAMPFIPSTSDGSESRFFQLPREIRDFIYAHYCYSEPRKTGPLAGCWDLPSSAPLAVSKQMRAEISPIYYESLKHTLMRDRICLRLPSNNAPGYSRYAGWNLWYLDFEKSTCCFNVWVRDGTDEGDYAAWWVDARNLCSLSEFAKFNTPLGGVYASFAFAQLVGALQRLQAMSKMAPIPFKVKVRLNKVIGKVQRNLKDVKAREATKTSTQPQPPDLSLNNLAMPAPPGAW